jgi:hypothetical protein
MQDFVIHRRANYRQKTSTASFALTSGNEVAGWVAALPVSSRCGYVGVIENSVYVAESARGHPPAPGCRSSASTAAKRRYLYHPQAASSPRTPPASPCIKRVGFLDRRDPRPVWPTPRQLGAYALIDAADLIVVLGTRAQLEPTSTPIEVWDTDEPSLRRDRRH